MKRIAAACVTALLVFGAGATPIEASQIKKPTAVPGQFCAAKNAGDWTKTSKYGRLACRYAGKNHNRRYYRWRHA